MASKKLNILTILIGISLIVGLIMLFKKPSPPGMVLYKQYQGKPGMVLPGEGTFKKGMILPGEGTFKKGMELPGEGTFKKGMVLPGEGTFKKGMELARQYHGKPGMVLPGEGTFKKGMELPGCGAGPDQRSYHDIYADPCGWYSGGEKKKAYWYMSPQTDTSDPIEEGYNDPEKCEQLCTDKGDECDWWSINGDNHQPGLHFCHNRKLDKDTVGTYNCGENAWFKPPGEDWQENYGYVKCGAGGKGFTIKQWVEPS